MSELTNTTEAVHTLEGPHLICNLWASGAEIGILERVTTQALFLGP